MPSVVLLSICGRPYERKQDLREGTVSVAAICPAL
jgi:hypothetical protein